MSEYRETRHEEFSNELRKTIKGCPLCGSKKYLDHISLRIKRNIIWIITCCACDLTLENQNGTQKQIIQLWNKRRICASSSAG